MAIAGGSGKDTGEEKLVKARSRLHMKEPWYGSFSMMMHYKKSDAVPTMGVRMIGGGSVECVYNPEFLEPLSVEQIYGVIKHEIEHIVRLHPVREGHRSHDAWNFAADMCVNGRRSNPRCAYRDGSNVIVPMENAVWIPEDWGEKESAETYYNKFPTKKCSSCSMGSGRGRGGKDKSGQGSGGQCQGGCKDCPAAGGQVMDDHGIWSDSTVGQDEARQIVKEMADQASSRSMGGSPGHLEDALSSLNRPVIKWKYILRRFMGRHCGNRRRTHSRQPRRNPVFGAKGVSHHAAATISIIMDTSGSIGQHELSQFFGEIDLIASKTNVGILMWDGGFQDFKNYRKGDWKKWKVKGRGGTERFDEASKWLLKNHLAGDAMILFTDGYLTDRTWPKYRGVPLVYAITAPEVEGPDAKPPCVVCKLNCKDVA